MYVNIQFRGLGSTVMLGLGIKVGKLLGLNWNPNPNPKLTM